MRILSPYLLRWFPGEYQQNNVSAFIRESYSQFYHASLSHCMPWLLGLYDANGELKAACGVQPASMGKIYLEHYLDVPVEALLSAHLPHPVSRDAVVEIGNFAASDGASARIMYAALCLLLNHYCYSWIVFTGTKKIRNTFFRLNLQPITLMPADPSRLGAEAREWGDYYQHDPQIMAGELTGGQSTLSQTSLLLGMFTELPLAPWVVPCGESYVSEHA
ncbi:thermostable hemolysin [Pantoea sp. C2G6]|uniref:thermostable hemolysin n=1 Tax=Pantoea sp. C2G6 TaxID=3243084 RepID=UPI003ED91532